MKKFFPVAVIALFSLSACVPGLLGGGAEEAPAAEAVDIAATVDAESSTQAVQTLAALATPTMEPPTPTEELPATATETLTPTEEVTATLTETENAVTVTETPGSESADAATETTATPTETSTPAVTATSVYPSPTSPIAINLPPESLVPRHRIEVRNKTKGPVYISLQGTSEGGYKPIIEYDIPRFATVKFEVPEGYYTVVVYVGKDPMIGYTVVNGHNQVSIIINRDEIKIEK